MMGVAARILLLTLLATIKLNTWCCGGGPSPADVWITERDRVPAIGTLIICIDHGRSRADDWIITRLKTNQWDMSPWHVIVIKLQ